MFYELNTGLQNNGMLGVTLNYQKHYRFASSYEFDGNLLFLIGVKEFPIPKLSGGINLDLIWKVNQNWQRDQILLPQLLLDIGMSELIVKQQGKVM